MNNRLALFTFIIPTLLAGCASTPTSINGLNLENSGLTSDIELNGVLISQGDKFTLDKAFHVPTIPSVDIPTAPWEFSVSFTDIPIGPWEFDGSTLFPEFNSYCMRCELSGCDPYIQLKGPFINVECESIFLPKASITYWERWMKIEQKKTKGPAKNKEREKTAEPEKAKEREKTEVEYNYTTGDIIVGAIGLTPIVAIAIFNAPGVIIESGVNELGELGCSDSWSRIWFDHDKFFDTVKQTILNDYGSISVYAADIRQASMAYNTLANIDSNKRGEIEALVREWDDSIDKLLPDNVSMDNYRIHYSPYALVEIPRKQDWSKKRADIESDILSHYAKQHTSINRQMYSFNKSLKQRYGININLSTEAK
jgi:hypothetical protein